MPAEKGEKCGMPSASQWREWTLAGILILGIAADIANRYFGNWADSRVTAGQVEALTDKVSTLSASMTGLTATISLMPRPTDYAEQQKHLERIDQTFGAVGDRFNRDELATSDIAGRVTALERPAYRNPK